MTRSLQWAIAAGTLFLGCAGQVCGELNPLEVEEGTNFARRAATALLRGPQRVFLETLDADRILIPYVGVEGWRELTPRQKDELRSFVRERFARALSPPRSGAGEIAWSSARPAGESSLFADMGLKFGEKTLKTRWVVERVRDGWRIMDIRLSDPGISLAQSSIRSLGPKPVRRGDRRNRALNAAFPRLLGAAGILLVVLFARRRVPPPRRMLLYLTAAAPALLFLVDGALAVRRAVTESYALPPVPREPWRRSGELALRAQRDGKIEEARERWSEAMALGDSPGPIAYQMGLAERQRGNLKEARAHFERALSELEPAPGAARELAVLALAENRHKEARAHLQHYLSEAGPDPDTLSLLAVAETNLGNHEAAMEAIGEARAIICSSLKGIELEARIRARAGDASGAVTALRALEAGQPLDRWGLRGDPAYLPIATDPVWVGFLAETPTGTPVVKPTPGR